ncbi:MAG: DUF4159 domain-containing protein [Prosthecobacter sp.]|jgi:hypothetical protein|uniref:DUF4159 domain-containing protein n=1 Tax=Prosthecobacter sp. TaxID=1965333 RepID=UPI0019E8F7BF|nr:DUF4159 domain-containing protein [Prosthecobacter sp.]MBE2285250.1 DUF4159 domain-containing protein [Prosthecobacter sp.]
MKLAAVLLFASVAAAADLKPFRIACGNLVYSMDEKTSVCFADYFLGETARLTGLNVEPSFLKLKLGDEELFTTPFCVFTGTGDFKLSEKERANLRAYLQRGGFMVASPGCSDAAWVSAFRREIEGTLPEAPMKVIPMTHPIFDTVHKVPQLNLTKKKGIAMLHGIEIDGRLALVFSPEGLNDTHHTKGCCCCGGNEIGESMLMNINLLVYALLY